VNSDKAEFISKELKVELKVIAGTVFLLYGVVFISRKLTAKINELSL
jgi:hypothetical protein